VIEKTDHKYKCSPADHRATDSDLSIERLTIRDKAFSSILDRQSAQHMALSNLNGL
jgi:hypothetical protein